MRAELLHAEWRTDMPTVILPFRNFAKTPKNMITLCFCAFRSYPVLIFSGLLSTITDVCRSLSPFSNSITW
jgi:hypothetical protein